MLSVPDYTPATVVDNTQWETENADRFLLDGRLLKMETATNIKAYHTNMAAYIQVGNFLDALREYGVYDNTRIIIVSDHGHRERQLDQLILDSTDIFKDVENYFPLLMVKDFNSTELTTCHEFMTIADVATLATKDVIENPINPFTGKVINNDEKYAHDQIVIVSDQWNPNINNGNTFLPARWASIHDDLWVAENWTFYDKEIVLTEHALPEE
jgi:membrane-anchored protein YejM (alkaline phosphatase superfamily)